MLFLVTAAKHARLCRSFTCDIPVCNKCIEAVRGHEILASGCSMFLIISSETLRELSGESLTLAFQINYSSLSFIVSDAVVIFSTSHFPHP